MRVLPGLVALLALAAGLGSARAAEAAVTGCPRAGTTVIARSDEAVAFRSRDKQRVAVCSLRTGHHALVGDRRAGLYVRHVWLKGPFALVALRVDFLGNFRVLLLADAARGALNLKLVPGRIDRIRLSSAGAALWTERRGLGRWAVQGLTPEGGWLLERTRSRPTNLALAGRRLGWTAAGRQRSFDAEVAPVRVAVTPRRAGGREPLTVGFRGRTGSARYRVDLTTEDEDDQTNCTDGAERAAPLRPAGFGYRLTLRPDEGPWCSGTATGTVSLQWGDPEKDPDDGHPCRRAIPCWGEAVAGSFEVLIR